MKKLFFYIAGIMLMYSCANGQTSRTNFASVPKPATGEAVATFGGGCFWSMSQALSELKGVHKVVSGYAGGTNVNPTYDDVCTRTTGHAEVVQVYYDPKVLNFETLAEGFFFAHDPTTLNRQGPDEGTDYRSIAFYRNGQEKAMLEQAVAKVNVSKHYSGKVVTQIVPFKVFYPAEKYHQGYYRAHLGDNPYLTSVSQPKVKKFEKAMSAYLKPEYK
ncbi:peptide-methionine (S)-S-oxide reductase MsrA [Mucilaginibacter koreensis]